MPENQDEPERKIDCADDSGHSDGSDCGDPGDQSAVSDRFDPLAEMSVDQAVEAGVKAFQDNALPESSLLPCPDCGTMLEPWQVVCHKCQRQISKDQVPVIEDTTEEPDELEGSAHDWLDKGAAAMTEERFAEAQACFMEALYRSKSLPDSARREIVLRKQLAQALEKQEKRREASEQYARLYQIKSDLKDQDSGEFEKRARQLSMSTVDVMSAAGSTPQFRTVSANEAEVVPLYCEKCKRLLLEAEVYGFRNGKLDKVRCFCGFEGTPVGRTDESYLRALKQIPEVRSKKEHLIQAASGSFERGKRRVTAVMLAALLGTFGAHKFYLGERAQGIAYALLCWTGVPTLLGLFDAFHYSQMSQVTFN
ncbi:MAG TPA: NINE protein, partial [Chroococcales cyanobacterium]